MSRGFRGNSNLPSRATLLASTSLVPNYQSRLLLRESLPFPHHNRALVSFADIDYIEVEGPSWLIKTGCLLSDRKVSAHSESLPAVMLRKADTQSRTSLLPQRRRSSHHRRKSGPGALDTFSISCYLWSERQRTPRRRRIRLEISTTH
jgi:hypothetical protein